MKAVKSKHDVRTKKAGVTFYNEECEVWLKKYLESRHDNSERLFCIGYREFVRIWRKASKSAGVRITPQVLRRWHSTELGELVPIIILATNRGVARIRGTDVKSPLGFPLDLIDRAVIIATHEYDPESIKEILRIRSDEEKVKIERDALERLTGVGSKSSLRYAVQLLSLAAQNAKAGGREKVTVDDVERVDKLFMDIGEAAEHLKKYEDKWMMH